MITRTQSYYSLLNVVLLLVTTYTVREATIRNYIPGFNFWWLVGIGAFLIIAVAVIDYKLIYPSETAYNQHEAWKHRSPVRKEFAEMKALINQLKESNHPIPWDEQVGLINKQIREGMTWKTSLKR